MGRGLVGWVRASLPGLAMAGILSGAVALLVHRDRIEGKRWREAEAAKAAVRQAVFARGRLGETLALCAEGWSGELNFSHEPVALAWTRQGLDAYFAQGVDDGSLRHVRCSARGLSRGPRVAHPLHGLVPAEAPAVAEATGDGEWPRAVAAAVSPSFGEGDLAVELLRHPVTGRVLARRWRSGEGGARATLDPHDAPPFAFLPSSPGFEVAPGFEAPPLQALPRHRWLADEGPAFALLERELPPGARVSELRLEDDQLEISIAWPTPAFDGDPPAPYGQKSFDEYGVAGMAGWYPHTIPGFGCASGEALDRVRAALREAKARAGEPALASAWYSCSTAYSDGHAGVWHLQAK